MRAIHPFVVIVTVVLAALMVTAQVTPPLFPYPKPRPLTGNTTNTLSRYSQTIAPSAYQNENPLLWSSDVGGGLQSRLNSADRLAINTNWMVEGGMVYDASNRTYYGIDTNLVAMKPLFTIDGSWLGITSTNGFNNIYTANGTLTGPRTVNLGTNLLSFVPAAGPNYVNGRFQVSGIQFIGMSSATNAQFANDEWISGGAKRTKIITAATTLSSATNGQVLTLIDAPTSLVEYRDVPSLYSTDGALSANRTVDLGTNYISFVQTAGSNYTAGKFLVTGIQSIGFSSATNAQYASDEWIGGGAKRTKIITAGTTTSTVTNGQVLTLIDAPNSLAEYRNVPSLYVTDGTLTGDRTVDLGTNRISFVQTAGPNYTAGRFQISALQFIGMSSATNAQYASDEWVGGASKRMKLITPGTTVGTAEAGQVLTLVDVANSLAEYQTPAAVKSTTTGTGTLSVDIFTISSPTPVYTNTSTYPDFFSVDMKPNSNGVGNDKVKVGSGPAKIVKTANLVALAPFEVASNSIARLVFSVPSDCWILNNPATTLAFDSTFTTGTTNGVTTLSVVPPPSSTPTNNSIAASKLSFTNAQSMMVSYPAAGAGTEIKLAPFWIVRNGVLQRNYKNMMFEVNSWFATGTFQDTANWQSGGGSGAASGIAGVGAHAGILQINTATTAASYMSFGYRTDLIQFDPGNKLYFFARLRIPTLSVSGGEAFKVSIGFGDTSSIGLFDTDCILVTYTDAVNGASENGARWNLDCGQASSHFQTDSGVTVSAAAGVWYDIEVEATTTQVDWWIDGVQKTAYTGANIPQGSNKFGPMIKIVGITGSTTRNFQLDQYNAWGVYSF